MGVPKNATKTNLGDPCFLPQSLIWGISAQLCGSDLYLRILIIFVTVSFNVRYVYHDMHNGALCHNVQLVSLVINCHSVYRRLDGNGNEAGRHSLHRQCIEPTKS